MKIFFFLCSIFILNSCTNTNSVNYSVEDTTQKVVCGLIGNEKQTYPSMKELENDGADFSHYGPCY